MIKKYIFFLTIILISSKSLSQKCVDKMDPFTNEKTVTYDYHYKTVYFELVEEEIKFEITFTYTGERSYEFNENTEILFKLENGNKISLNSIRKSIPKKEQIHSSANINGGFSGGMMMSRTQNFTTYSFAFLLTETELSQFSESKIDLIRVPDTDEAGFFDLEAKKETKKKIKAVYKGAICMNNSLNKN